MERRLILGAQLRPPLIARVGALIRRERLSRFAGGPLGYLWAYATPVAWIAFVVAFFWIVDRRPPIPVGVEIFVATGILPYAMLRQAISSTMRSVVSNRQMLVLHPITSHELIAAAALLELVNTILTTCLIIAVFAMVFEVPVPANLSKVVVGIGLAWAVGAGVGALFATIGQASDSFSRSVPIVLRPLFWISGIFYTATELPGTAVDILWWNPLFHCIELLREGFFLGYQSPISSITYPLAFAIICYAVSLAVAETIRARRLARHRL